MLMGNAGDPGELGFLSAPEYKNKLDMAFYENVHQASWEAFLEGYRRLTANTRVPHLVVLSMYGRANDYKLARYGLASTLMGDGYFHYGYDTLKLSPKNYEPVLWFDEFDLSGSSTTSWLGEAIDPPQYYPWKNGVYRRRFRAWNGPRKPQGQRKTGRHHRARVFKNKGHAG